jgi:basic membrane protein A
MARRIPAQSGRRGIVRTSAVLALALVLAACGGTAEEPAAETAPAEEAAPAEAAPAEPSVRVALVLPGPINDRGFNQSAYEALAVLESELGAETAFSESTPVPDFETAFRDYASQGFDVVIGQGFQFGEIAQTVAPEFPDVMFFASNNPAVDGDNAQGLMPQSWHSAYIAGVAAAIASKSGRIGGIAGMEFPAIRAQMNAFREGALAARPDVDVAIVYLGDQKDVERGKEGALAMIQDGRDVLYHIADNAGLGVIQAASDEGIFVIGWGKDQADVAPNAVMASQIVDQTAMIVDAVSRVANGERSGNTTFYGLDTAVTGLTAIASIVPNAADVQAAVDEVSARIISGELEVAYNPGS